MAQPMPAGPVVAVGVAVFRGERVLLVQRGREPHQGHWSLPGGRVERGESLRAAAQREVAEECGIAVAVGEPALVLNRVVRDAQGVVQYHYVIVDFVAEYLAEGGLEPVSEGTAGSDAQAIRWIHPDELPGLPLTPGLERYLQVIAAAHSSGSLGCALFEEL